MAKRFPLANLPSALPLASVKRIEIDRRAQLFPSGQMKEIRTDIQALRGLAVLLVVLHHAKMPFLPAGYLGVDVFFVISGFLITGLVKAGIERGDFRFSEFYFRRAKRLLPAAYVTFLTAALLAPLFLTSKELSDFAVQMIGAVTFTGNFVLSQQTGYFQGAGDLKPLLHVWSLAIEEQYYLIMPAALVFVPARRWLPLMVGVFAVSLILCAIGGHVKPVTTFYILPTRGWELAIGSIGALIGADSRLYRYARALFFPALLALLAIPFFPFGGNHPGPDALIMCLATIVVILRHYPMRNFGAPVLMLAAIGDFSYSLYLAHWPIFAFANNLWAGEEAGHPPIAVRIVALVLALGLGYLLYRYVETPVRRSNFRFSGNLLAKTLAASLGLILIPSGIAAATPGSADFQHIRRINFGFDRACEFGDRFVSKPECRNSEKPMIMVWGDSFAMHLVPGLAATSGEMGVIQATRANCGPLLGLAPIEKVFRFGYNKNWAEGCIAFNQSVIDYLAHAASIETVVLSSPFSQYVDSASVVDLKKADGAFEIIEPSAESALAGLRRSLDALRSLGKRVVIVAPPPSGGFNVGGCLERLIEGKPFLGAPQDCQIHLDDYHQLKRGVLDFLARAASQLDVKIFRFDAWLCGANSCRTSIDGIFVYRDGGHLSYDGSRLLAQRTDLASTLRSLAR
ncbi:acyltransferase family protein [Methylocapsa aurea]|uniref:acyltransferase family protein n=1 Tax=Methylocapsa aurea TaxID=663610 RepID=UPI00068FF751|nr:acyltransferase family protein [Methylocapsa aurea]